MDLKLLKMRCKGSKQHHVMFHELYSVSLPFCIAQNVRFEIQYKVLYFETPFLIIFKYYAWVSCDFTRTKADLFSLNELYFLKCAISTHNFLKTERIHSQITTIRRKSSIFPNICHHKRQYFELLV